MSQDTLLCLKKGGVSWGLYDDLPASIGMLCEQEKRRIVAMESQSTPNERNRLKYRALFSETDALIGNGGRRYFENCWRDASVNGSIDYDSTVVLSATHDTIMSPQHELGLPTVLRDMRSTLRLPAYEAQLLT